MVSWGNLANAGNSAFSGYQNADAWLAQRRQQQLQADAAKAYGEAMMKMGQPQPWRVPMANGYTPPPPAMTLQNFMQRMPQGMDPAAMGIAVDRFAPLARNHQMDEYRDNQIRLGQQRTDQMGQYRDEQTRLGQERNDQAARRLSLSQDRMAARDTQNEIANKFRDRALQLQALGLEQRNPQAARAFQATQSKFIRANDRVTSLMRMIGDADRNLAMGVNRDIYDARTMELNTALKAAMAELDAVGKELDQYDPSGQALPQPTGTQPAQPIRGPQIPPKALEILRSNPGSASQFEKTFGLPPGGANQYLQPSPPGGQGGPLGTKEQRIQAVQADERRAAAEAAARAAQKYQQGPAVVAPGQRTSPEWQSMLAAPAGPSPAGVIGEPTTAPQGEGLQPWGDAPPIRPGEGFSVAPGEEPYEKLRAELAARGVPDAATMDPSELRVRKAMLDLVDDTKPVVDLYGSAAKRSRELSTRAPVKFTPAQDKALADMQRKLMVMYSAETNPAARKKIGDQLDRLIQKRAAGANGFKGS